MISLVPVDVGKPTVRLSKQPIVDGTCTWENPVYETVKLIKEIKSGRIREKFYYVIVSTVSHTLFHLHSRSMFKFVYGKWQFSLRSAKKEKEMTVCIGILTGVIKIGLSRRSFDRFCRSS